MNDDLDIDTLITGALQGAPSKRCKVCQNDRLRETVARWLERRAEGEALPGLAPMFARVFHKLGDASQTKIRDHITLCLGLQHTTGKPL